MDSDYSGSNTFISSGRSYVFRKISLLLYSIELTVEKIMKLFLLCVVVLYLLHVL